jgi:predicted AAA+ superfamily ATPase
MYIKREITDKIVESLKSHELIILTGTRQTGKTTLTRLVSEVSGIVKENIFYYDLEDKSYRELFDLETGGIGVLRNILKIEGININNTNLIIFDEIQFLKDPSNLLKLLHDNFPQLKIIATGSSSLQIKHKFKDSLAGRKRVFNIEPLNFDEFLLFKGQSQLLNLRKLFKTDTKNDLTHLINSHKPLLIRLFEEYITYGGYPEVVLIDDKNSKIEKLHSISNAYIQKDIREFANIENIEAYNNLLKYIAVNSGNLVNISSVSKDIGISKSTVDKYITLLRETFIIDKLLPFYSNKNKEISKNYKLYFKDNGIRNLQLLNFNLPENRTDKGVLYENYVFNALENNKNILTQNYFYRTQMQTEIDFITKNENKLNLIEVKSSDFHNNIRAFHGFEEKNSVEFEISKKIIVNKSHLDLNEKLTFIPAYLF